MAVYNNASTILQVLAGIEETGMPIIVVDDGSDDGTTQALEEWSGVDMDPPRRTCRLAVNSGKAAAMRAGFDWARELGYTHALTFDADGQHDHSRIGAFLELLDAKGPDLLVVGSREPLARGYPLRNKAGRLLSNLAIRAHCGVSHGDVPCGMRIYPLARVAATRCISGRFAWEEEFITRAAWAGVDVGSVRIPSVYAPAGKRQSHYVFKRDWTEGIAIYTWLLLVALVPSMPRSGVVARHLRSLLAPTVSPFAGDMAGRTELLFLGASLLLAIVIFVLPLPASLPVVAVIAWIGLAWNVHVVMIALMIFCLFL